MEYYTVKEVAVLLSVNEETVRRWIRDEKLEAERGSGRQGSKVTSVALKKFLDENKGFMTTVAATNLGIAKSAAGAIMAGAAMASATIGGSLVAGVITGAISILKSQNKNKTEMKFELMEKENELNNIETKLKNEIAGLKNEIAIRENELENIYKKLKQLNEIASKVDEGGNGNGEN